MWSPLKYIFIDKCNWFTNYLYSFYELSQHTHLEHWETWVTVQALSSSSAQHDVISLVHLNWTICNQYIYILHTFLYLHLSVKGYGKAPTHFYPSYAPDILPRPSYTQSASASPGWSACTQAFTLRLQSHPGDKHRRIKTERCRGGNLLRRSDN